MEEHMIKAIESHYQHLLDKYWIDLLKNFKNNDMDSCISTIEKYAYILNQFNLFQKFKAHIIEEKNKEQNYEENEN